MSVHCLICGHQANWRDNGEVRVDDKTWVEIRIHNDADCKRLSKKAIDMFYAHRDCVEKWLNEYEGVQVNFNCKPIKVKEDAK